MTGTPSDRNSQTVGIADDSCAVRQIGEKLALIIVGRKPDPDMSASFFDKSIYLALKNFVAHSIYLTFI